MIFGKKQPKWEHPEYKVRRKAIEKIKDKQLLRQIAESDPDKRIQRVSFRLIRDESVYREMALESSRDHLRFMAAEEISDQEVLEKVALNDSSCFVKGIAIHCLKKKRSGRHFKTPITLFIQEKLPELEDEHIIGWMAQYNSKAEIRALALSKCEDSSIVVNRLRHDYNEKVREIAALKVNLSFHKNDLIEAAQNDTSDKVREAAMSRIGSQLAAAHQYTGKIGEPFCSEACRKKSHKAIKKGNQKVNHEICLICEKLCRFVPLPERERSLHKNEAILIYHQDKIRHICLGCRDKAVGYFLRQKSCTFCSKDLI